MEYETSPSDLFTPRQLQAFKELFEGKTIREIAYELHISRKTAEKLVYGQSDTRDKSNLGIYGVIEKDTGRRPSRATAVIYYINNFFDPLKESLIK